MRTKKFFFKQSTEALACVCGGNVINTMKFELLNIFTFYDLKENICL